MLTRTTSQIRYYLRSLNVASFSAVSCLVLEVQGNHKEENKLQVLDLWQGRVRCAAPQEAAACVGVLLSFLLSPSVSPRFYLIT